MHTMDKITKNPYVPFGLILGLSLVASVAIGAYTFYTVRSINYISTTGSSTETVTSDQVKWSSSITRPATAGDLQSAYAEMSSDLKSVKDFLSQNGVTADSIDVSPVYMNEVYEQNPGPEKKYNLVQNITVQSDDVAKIGDLAKNTTALTDKGILFSTNSLEYYYSKLADARVSLLSDAIKDAKARATEIAKAGGKKIGAINSASNGVVQVLAPNSQNVSDYGTYDTSTVDKVIMITVRASFEIK